MATTAAQEPDSRQEFGCASEGQLSDSRAEIERQLASSRNTRNGHFAGGHERLLYGVELDRRKSQSRGHPISVLRVLQASDWTVGWVKSLALANGGPIIVPLHHSFTAKRQQHKPSHARGLAIVALPKSNSCDNYFLPVAYSQTTTLEAIPDR